MMVVRDLSYHVVLFPVLSPFCFSSFSVLASLLLFNRIIYNLVFTNKPKSFQNTIGISRELSDFQEMVLKSMKTTFPKATRKVLYYRDMKKVYGLSFNADLKNSLKTIDPLSLKL